MNFNLEVVVIPGLTPEELDRLVAEYVEALV